MKIKKENSNTQNPMKHPEEQPIVSKKELQFGKLLLVLIISIAFIGILSYFSISWFV
tara:strand:- start:1667 stop:1837 length:171 start_codon:yes stop_codon:yes gene_type:complete